MIDKHFELHLEEGANIISSDGYHARFLEYIGAGLTNPQAWEALENELRTKYGVSRYQTYDGFRSARSRYQNGKGGDRVVLIADH